MAPLRRPVDAEVVGRADDHRVGALARRLARRLRRRSGRRQHHARQDRHPAGGGPDERPDHDAPLARGEPRALAAASQDEEPAAAALEHVLHQDPDRALVDLAGGVERRDRRRDDAAEGPVPRPAAPGGRRRRHAEARPPTSVRSRVPVPSTSSSDASMMSSMSSTSAAVIVSGGASASIQWLARSRRPRRRAASRTRIPKFTSAGIPLARDRVADELDADQEPLAPDVSDHGQALCHLAEARRRLDPARAGVLDDAVVEDLPDGREADRGGHRVPAEGVAGVELDLVDGAAVEDLADPVVRRLADSGA